MDNILVLADTYGQWILLMSFTGVAGGLISGLLGVGGGIVIVPVAYFVLSTLGFDEGIRMQVAVATSLATIIATSSSSALGHRRHGAVDGRLLRSWGPAIFLGVLLGTVLGGMVSARVLTAVFAITALVVALNMVLRSKGNAFMPDFPNAAVKSALGAIVGLVSAMMGIGGGTLSVPILTAFGYDIRRAVGTASAIGFIIAIPATIGYIIAGWNNPALPPGSLGYVNLIGLMAIVPLSILTAPLGVRIAHAVPRRVLSYGFGAFLALTSARMFNDLFF